MGVDECVVVREILEVPSDKRWKRRAEGLHEQSRVDQHPHLLLEFEDTAQNHRRGDTPPQGNLHHRSAELRDSLYVNCVPVRKKYEVRSGPAEQGDQTLDGRGVQDLREGEDQFKTVQPAHVYPPLQHPGAGARELESPL